MWINNNISKPLRKGNYKTLVDFDGLGNLIEMEDEYFNGDSWDLYSSSVQFISFWWAEKEDYKIITDKIEAEIVQTEVGSYQLSNIKVNTTYRISQEKDEQPKIEKND